MNIKKRYSVILSIILFLYSAFAVALPLLSSMLVDGAVAIANGNSDKWNTVIICIILIVSDVLLEVIINLIRNSLYYHFSLKLEKELKTSLYDNILKKSFNDLKDFHAAELEMLFNTDIANIMSKELDTIPSITRDLTRALLSCALVGYLDWRFLVALLVIGVFAYFGAKLYSHIIRPHNRNVLEKEGKNSSYIVESISNIKLIKAYNSYEFAENRFNSITDELISKKKKRNIIFILSSSAMFAFGNIIFALSLVYGALAISYGLITYGVLVALLQLLNAIEVPALNFSSLLNQLAVAEASNARLAKCINLQNEEATLKCDSFDSIIFDHVSFKYDDKEILKDLSFELNKGDKVLVSGPSGIGKTTMFMLMLGLIKPDSGKITIKLNNKELEASSVTRDIFGYVPQENILFSGSILDNIYTLTGVSDINKINDALTKANLLSEINALPLGLNTILNERGAGLSIGQIQRLLIAIAVLKDSKVLLLDEFSSALDSSNEEYIFNELCKLDKTIIYITHRQTLFTNDKVIKLGE